MWNAKWIPVLALFGAMLGHAQIVLNHSFTGSNIVSATARDRSIAAGPQSWCWLATRMCEFNRNLERLAFQKTFLIFSVWQPLSAYLAAQVNFLVRQARISQKLRKNLG